MFIIGHATPAHIRKSVIDKAEPTHVIGLIEIFAVGVWDFANAVLAHVGTLHAVVAFQLVEVAAKGVVLLLGQIGVCSPGDVNTATAIVEPVVFVAGVTVAIPVAGLTEIVRALAGRIEIQIVSLVAANADGFIVVEITALCRDGAARSLIDKELEGALGADCSIPLQATRYYSLLLFCCSFAGEGALDVVAADIHLLESVAPLENVLEGVAVAGLAEDVQEGGFGVTGVGGAQ